MAMSMMKMAPRIWMCFSSFSRRAEAFKAREEADGTYAAGPFLDGTYVKGCAGINQ